GGVHEPVRRDHQHRARPRYRGTERPPRIAVAVALQCVHRGSMPEERRRHRSGRGHGGHGSPTAGTGRRRPRCTIAAMNKPPSKRGGGRGGKPRKPAGNRAAPGKKKLPSWMPDPGLARAMGRPGPAPAATPPAATPPAADPHAEREAQRYERPIASREMILHTLAAHDGPMAADALADALGLDDAQRRDALDKRLRAMLRDGQLLQNRRGGFVPAERADLIAGTVIANPDGFGFLR